MAYKQPNTHTYEYKKKTLTLALLHPFQQPQSTPVPCFTPPVLCTSRGLLPCSNIPNSLLSPHRVTAPTPRYAGGRLPLQAGGICVAARLHRKPAGPPPQPSTTADQQNLGHGHAPHQADQIYIAGDRTPSEKGWRLRGFPDTGTTHCCVQGSSARLVGPDGLDGPSGFTMPRASPTRPKGP